MTLRSLALGLFWCGVAGCGWTLVGYPVWLATQSPRRWKTTSRRPSVSIIVPAYCEREALQAKLRALSLLEYEDELLELIVVVDHDVETARGARETRPDANVIFNPNRRGKLAAVLEAVDQARGEVVLLTDANNLLAPQALSAAVRHFGDESIWGVTGQRHEQGGLYDRYEAMVRRLESISGSVAAASGEMLLVRRDRIPPPPNRPTVNDDLWILCRLVERGGRVVFEPAARSLEPAGSAIVDLERRTRMMAGLVAQLGEVGRVPSGFAFRLASHKFARLGMPPWLFAMFFGSAVLVRRSPYREAFGLQVLWYVLGMAGIARQPRGAVWAPAIRAAREFLIGNAATLRGIVRAAHRGQDVKW